MSRRYRWDDYGYPPRSVPRAAKGGIRAESKRGRFGESWWARWWMEVLESFDLGARLSRGRSYARSGQVLSIDFAKGTVAAKVQGSRPKPYEVRLVVKTLTADQWQKVAKIVSSQAIYAAKLLAGELPSEIEAVVRAEKVSLFPERISDLKTDCSCPDWSNPCKHIAAVYCLLAEELDSDPFLLLKMRGMSRDEFLELLAGYGATRAVEPIPPEPLPADPAAFWTRPQFRVEPPGPVQPPAMSAALVRRLGKFPFWRGTEPFLETMDEVFRRASARVRDWTT